MKIKPKRRMKIKPTRKQLQGMSPSEFKTFLKHRCGHTVARDFFKGASISTNNGRAYRFRWWDETEFLVDISCPLAEFDRWANSVDEVVKFSDWSGKCVDNSAFWEEDDIL